MILLFIYNALVQAGAHDINVVTRTFVLPPGTPKYRVRIVQKAFTDTMKDPEFVADARKSKLELGPVPGEELERIVHAFLKLNLTEVSQLKKILK